MNWESEIDIYTLLMRTCYIAQGTLPSASGDLSEKEIRKWGYIYMHAKSLQSCLIPCDLMDYSPPVSSIHGISQARVLEWVAISFSRGSSPRRN